MSGQAHLSDTRALEGLLDALDHVPRVIEEGVAEASALGAARIDRFRDAVERAADDVHEAERALQDAADDDVRAEEDRLESARWRLRRLEDVADELDSALAIYNAARHEVQGLEQGTLRDAQAYVEERLRTAHAYLALGVSGADQRAGGLPAEPRGTLSQPVRAPADLPALPHGFSWIPIAQINGLPAVDQLEWKKIAPSIVETGMRAFQQDLVPRLRAGPVDPDDLFAFDRSDGRNKGGIVDPTSLGNLYEIFFGRDSIAASPLPDGGFELSSGRHRTAIAARLGWTSVPARVLGKGAA